MKKIIVTLLLCAVSAINNYAQTIDSAFAVNGFVPYGGPLSNGQLNVYEGNNTAIQQDGKLVVAENYTDGNNSNLYFYTYRYNTDGTPDVTFGVNGVSAIFAGDQSDNRDLQIQPDGKIVITGATEYCILGVCGALQFIMMRLNTDGSLDSTFGINGKLITTDIFGTSGLFANPRTVKLLNNGKFIIGGKGPNLYPFVARLNSNGFADSTFGVNGIFSDTALRTTFRDLAINAYGELFILMDEYHYNNVTGADTTNLVDNVILKLTPNGVTDNTFGTAGGRFVFNISNDENPTSIAVMPDQSLVVVGDEQYNNTENYNWNGTGSNGYGETNKGYIAFVNANGTMATNIPNGIKSLAIPTDTATFIHKIIVLNNNRLMVCGRTITKLNGNYQEKAFMSQVDADGNYQTDFNTTGYMVFDYGATGATGWNGRSCAFNDVDVMGNGDVYATGYRNHTAGNTGLCLFLLKLKNTVTSIADHEPAAGNISIYPNPAQGAFTIETQTPSTWDIYNAIGKPVKSGRLIPGRNKIELSSAAAGNYFVRVTDEKNTVTTSRIIIQ